MDNRPYGGYISKRLKTLCETYPSPVSDTHLIKLLRILETGETMARCEAALALGDSGDQSVIHPLAEAFYSQPQTETGDVDESTYAVLVTIGIALCSFDELEEFTSVIATESGYPKSYKIKELREYQDRAWRCLLKLRKSDRPDFVHWANRYLTAMRLPKREKS